MPLGKEFWQFLIQWNIYLPYDQASSLLVIYPIGNEGICAHTELFMNILLTFIWWNPNWEQHKCLSTDECTSESVNSGMVFIKISKLPRSQLAGSISNKYSKVKEVRHKGVDIVWHSVYETLERKCPMYLQNKYMGSLNTVMGWDQLGRRLEAIIWSDGSAHYFDFSVDKLSETFV